jgi:hypothetical protein
MGNTGLGLSPNIQIQPRPVNESSSSNNVLGGTHRCRLPDCRQTQFFDDRKQEHLDYCRDHILYVFVTRHRTFLTCQPEVLLSRKDLQLGAGGAGSCPLATTQIIVAGSVALQMQWERRWSPSRTVELYLRALRLHVRNVVAP